MKKYMKYMKGGSTIGLAGWGIGLFFVVILGMGAKNKNRKGKIVGYGNLVLS